MYEFRAFGVSGLGVSALTTGTSPVVRGSRV